MEWPTPRTVKGTQSFLGFANFYHRFIPKFSTLARPLHNLMHKDTPWTWGDREQNALKGIKLAMSTQLVLAHPNTEKPFYLEADASGLAMGAVLTQRQDVRGLHPVAYMSSSFMAPKRNYDTHDKELLAIIWALENWRIHL